MSKFLPDPQIQSLRAMRAGDIAFAQGGTMTVGVQKIAFAQPLIQLARSLIAVPDLGSVSSPAAETPTVGVAFTETLSVDALQSIPLLTSNSLVTPDVPAGEAPTVGVATSTSVV